MPRPTSPVTVPSSFPEGVPAPEDGSLPESVVDGALERAFGVYVHVPYCRVRCGYCDFNTYTATELQGTNQETYAGEVAQEINFARTAMERAGLPVRPASTVFFGGGTPTLLPPEDLASMLASIQTAWGLAPNAEVTTEANPDSVDARALEVLRDAGFTRVSFGMQSAVPHVLNTLDRTHNPESVPRVVQWAKDAGLQVSLDLIYGTPGESLDDWKRSLDAALECEPDHLSAYALIVEPGTKLHAQIKRGVVPPTDDDLHAEMYELADSMLETAGYHWYEISNWSRSDATRSRHNLSYWTGEDWWAAGPGAHSHIGGVRWWNVKHPAAYAARIAQGISPAFEREMLSDEDQRVERILLETRISDGLPIDVLDEDRRHTVAGLVADGLIEGAAAIRGTVRLTRRGRLLADTVVHELLGSS